MLITLLIIWILGLIGAALLVKRVMTALAIEDRLFKERSENDSLDGRLDLRKILASWLRGGGYLNSHSEVIFIVSAAAALIMAGLAVMVFSGNAMPARMMDALTGLPGNVGELFFPVVYLAPYIIFFVTASVPWVIVRSARRECQEKIEQDIPIFLELISTLGEAGLGFDEALAKSLEVLPSGRPLVRELTIFQGEVMSGRARVQCFWRLRSRLQVGIAASFISALVQAEQIGGRISDILRHQSADALQRRRLRAMELAAALPVKVLFPMMVCFLPSIFVFTMGPVLYQFAELMSSIIKGA